MVDIGNRFSVKEPFYSLDGKGFGSRGPGSSDTGIREERLFKKRIADDAQDFLKILFNKAGLNARFEILEDNSIEIRPARSKKPWFKKQVIPSGLIDASMGALNTHYSQEGLGRFSADHNSDYGSYRVSFDSQANSREVNEYMLSANPTGYILDKYAHGKTEIDEKQAFLLYQALELVGGTRGKQVLAPNNLEEKHFGVLFSEQFKADQFFNYVSALIESKDKLVDSLGLSVQRSSDEPNLFKIYFNPDWESEVFLDRDQWKTRNNMEDIEAVFDVRLVDKKESI